MHIVDVRQANQESSASPCSCSIFESGISILCAPGSNMTSSNIIFIGVLQLEAMSSSGPITSTTARRRCQIEKPRKVRQPKYMVQSYIGFGYGLVGGAVFVLYQLSWLCTSAPGGRPSTLYIYGHPVHFLSRQTSVKITSVSGIAAYLPVIPANQPCFDEKLSGMKELSGYGGIAYKGAVGNLRHPSGKNLNAQTEVQRSES